MGLQNIFNGLLEATGIYPPARAYNQIHWLMTKDANVDQLNVLLKKHPKAGQWRRRGEWESYPLEEALMWDNAQYKTAAALIEHDPSVLHLANPRNGQTSFVKAAYSGRLETMKFLADRGANLTDRDKWGCSALHYAAGSSREKHLVEWLLEKGVPANIRNANGGTPLMICAQRSALEICDVLLAQYGIVINGKHPLMEERDNKGRTPLMHAAMKGNGPMVKKLLACGADIEAKDNEGMTAMTHAFSNFNHYAAVELMRAGGRMLNAELAFNNFIGCVYDSLNDNADKHFYGMERLGRIRLMQEKRAAGQRRPQMPHSPKMK